MKKENFVFIIILIIVFILLVLSLIGIYITVNNKPKRVDVSEDSTFSINFIKKSNEKIGQNNYTISPYSVEIALSMLRDGANNNTKKELEEIVPERSIKTLSVKNKVNIANAIFIKDKYKGDLVSNYSNTLKEKYQAEFVVDKFTTPDKINDWVNQKTNKMIPKILDSISEEFVLGLANAIAMEEVWQTPFECKSTEEQDFTLITNKKEKRLMMNKTFEEGISYFENDNAKGIIMPYKKYNPYNGEETEEEGEQLEFIAILPKDINTYINSFDLDTLKQITNQRRYASDQLKISVFIPKFEFDFDFKEFKTTLMEMGIKDVFTPAADLSNMLNNHPDAYVSEAIHKTYVKVDEKGTKAAAVTYFGVNDTAMPMEEIEYVNITFDHPFIYLIKDTTSNEILFFGTIYDPKWDKNNSCE